MFIMPRTIVWVYVLVYITKIELSIKISSPHPTVLTLSENISIPFFYPLKNAKCYKKHTWNFHILSGQYYCVPFMQKKHAIRLQIKKQQQKKKKTKKNILSVSIIKGGVFGIARPFGIGRGPSNKIVLSLVTDYQLRTNLLKQSDPAVP